MMHVGTREGGGCEMKEGEHKPRRKVLLALLLSLTPHPIGRENGRGS